MRTSVKLNIRMATTREAETMVVLMEMESGCLFTSKDSRRPVYFGFMYAGLPLATMVAGTLMGECLTQHNNLVCNSVNKSTRDIPQLGSF